MALFRDNQRMLCVFLTVIKILNGTIDQFPVGCGTIYSKILSGHTWCFLFDKAKGALYVFLTAIKILNGTINLSQSGCVTISKQIPPVERLEVDEIYSGSTKLKEVLRFLDDSEHI